MLELWSLLQVLYFLRNCINIGVSCCWSILKDSKQRWRAHLKQPSFPGAFLPGSGKQRLKNNFQSYSNKLHPKEWWIRSYIEHDQVFVENSTEWLPCYFQRYIVLYHKTNTSESNQSLRRNIGQKSHDQFWRVFSSWSHEVPSSWAGKTLDAPPSTFPLLHSTTSSSDCSHFIHCAHIVLSASYKDVYAL